MRAGGVRSVPLDPLIFFDAIIVVIKRDLVIPPCTHSSANGISACKQTVYSEQKHVSIYVPRNAEMGVHVVLIA